MPVADVDRTTPLGEVRKLSLDTRAQRYRLILACGLIELMSWGALYYTVPVLHERIAADTGWSVTLLTLTYSSALVLAALLGPRVGRRIDRLGPRGLVVAGTAVGSVGLLVVATAPSMPVQALGMLLVGMAQAATLYPPIFAALTIWFGDDKAHALTVVTLFGGFSSTVFAPLMAPLVAALQWRWALAAVAVSYTAVVIPIAWFGLRVAWPDPAETTPERSRGHTATIVRTWRFRALQGGLMLAGIGLYATTLNLIGLAREQGYSFAFAATVFGLVGVGQVAGRLLYLPLSNHGTPRAQTAVQISAACLAVGALGVCAQNPTAFVVAAVAAGAVRGAHTLVVASGVADRWGVAGFGALSGTFNRPIALAIAVSPFVGSTIASVSGSYAAAALILAAASACGIVFARWT